MADIQRIETRDAYGKALAELGRANDKVVVLDADLWRSTKASVFAEAFPDRFFDMGIAEQDMISTGAGLAATGFKPFLNSFAMFLIGRAYDQIRLQLCYVPMNVILGGSSAGLTEGPDGASHQSFDDVALMRGLPNMTVLVPADATETEQCVWAAAELHGPAYIRLGRYPTPVLFDAGYKFQIGKAVVMKQGRDVAILADGHMTARALDAAGLLDKEGISASVVNASSIKPFDKETVCAVAEAAKAVITVEESSIIGGLGSATAEALAEKGLGRRLVRMGMQDCFGQSGTADQLLECYGLTAENIAATAKTALR
jgi:transketolase